MHQDDWVVYIPHVGADIVNDILACGQVAPVPRTYIPVIMGKATAFHFLDNLAHHIGRAIAAPSRKAEQTRGIPSLFIHPVIYLFIVG